MATSSRELQAEVAQANHKAEESLGALRQAQSTLEEAQALLDHATDGSSQADTREAVAQLQQAISNLSEVEQLVRAAISTAEGYAAQV